MASNELCFTVLGSSGAGKTTMLACMQRKFDEILPGSIIADRAAFSTLTLAYRKLEEEANSSELEFGVGIENTENLREYGFTITAGRANIPMKFWDFPGGWIDSARNSKENYERVIRIVKRSRVIFVAVNTPYLMEANGRWRKEARIDDTSYVLKNALIDGNDNKLVLILPIKCEKYTRNPALQKRMYAVIEEAFADILSLANNPVYRKRLAIAVLPIHTVGNATFSRFEHQEGGRLPREVYLKNRGAGFGPKYADQPLRYAMSFLLNEYARGGDYVINDSFSRADFKELCAFIRGGMEIDNGLFKFYSGREMVTDAAEIKIVPAPPVRKEPPPVPIKQQDETGHVFLWIVIIVLVVIIVILLSRPPEVRVQTFWEWVWSLF